MSTSCLTSGGPSLPLPFLQAFESNSQAQRVQEGARASLDAPAMGGVPVLEMPADTLEEKT